MVRRPTRLEFLRLAKIMRWRSWGALGMGMILVAGVGSCGKKDIVGRQVSVESVSLTPVRRFVGTFEATRQREIYSEVDGQVSKLLVKVGDDVAQGDILLELSKGQMEKALAAEKDEQVKKGLQWALNACEVRAPEAGRIAAIQVNPGTTVGGEWGALDKVALITLLPADAPIELRMAVPLAYADGLEVGTRLKIDVRAKDIEPMEGSVASVTPREKDILCVIDWPAQDSWRPEPGWSARIDWPSSPRPEMPVVPVEALVKKDGWIVKVVKQGSVSEVEVVLGQGDGNRVEVTEGLKPGDVVLCP